MDHVTLVTHFQGQSVVRKLIIDIAYKHTKFDDVPKIFQWCEILKLATWP